MIDSFPPQVALPAGAVLSIAYAVLVLVQGRYARIERRHARRAGAR